MVIGAVPGLYAAATVDAAKPKTLSISQSAGWKKETATGSVVSTAARCRSVRQTAVDLDSMGRTIPFLRSRGVA